MEVERARAMAKDKKSHERSRQAKIMRQRARAKERQRASAVKEPMDEFEMFRADLIPPDLDAAEWTRSRILHDLSGLRPAQALPQFMATFVDPSAVEENEEGRSQIEWGLFLWQLALLEPGEREESIQKASRSVASEPEQQEQFRQFATDVVRTHEEMFPRLHAHVARLRGKPRTDLPSESILADIPATEEEIRALADARAAAAGLPPASRFSEYAQPLIQAAGADRKALEHAFTLAIICWTAAELPLDERAAFLADERERFLSEEERAAYDAAVPMMMRRHREMFASAAEAPHGPPAAAEARAPVEDAPARRDEQPATEDGDGAERTRPEQAEPGEPEESVVAGAPAAVEEKPSLLGRLFRRGG
jgi:hypothetical protein